MDMADWLRWILDLLYPPRCMICHRFLEPKQPTVCQTCLDNLPEFDGAEPKVRFAERCVATFFYEEPLRTSFLRYKFGGLNWYAGQYGKWMSVTVSDKLSDRYDLITWVPVSSKRRKTRGYDQAQLLCQALADELGTTPVAVLEKYIHNREQSGLRERSARQANTAGVYRVLQPQLVSGKRILLVDDIVTTGATLSECARVLKTAGAQQVVCAVLATPRKT